MPSQLLDLPASELASWNEHDNRTAAFFLTHALAFVDGCAGASCARSPPGLTASNTRSLGTTFSWSLMAL